MTFLESPFRLGLFDAKVAFIAGGTSGINLGIAMRFAQLGAKVAVAGRKAGKAQHACSRIGAVNFGGALGVSADVRRCEEVRAGSAASYVTGAILNVDGGSELGAAFDPAR